MAPPSDEGYTPGLVYTAISTVIAIVIGVFALTVRQPPPPSVAEFAPSAQEQITDAPREQTSDVGSAPGGGLGATPSPTPVAGTPRPTPTPIDVPRTKRCFGEPPRQTEDPQSPPCIAYWVGDNGGATSTGVTRDLIRVAWPNYGPPPLGEDETALRAMVAHFNNRYQLYGRKIELFPFPPAGGAFANPSPSDMKANATYVARNNAFASLGYGDRKGAEHFYYDELQRLRVISAIHRQAALMTETSLNAKAPFEWHTQPGIDMLMRNYGEFVCNVLNGKPATHAGPGVSGAQRKFGIIYQRSSDGTAPDIGPLSDTLAACGIVDPPTVQTQQSSDATRTGQNQMLQMRGDDVTSIICLCDAGETRSVLMPSASAQAYYPEWLISSYIDQDLDNSWSQAPVEQARNAFGLTFRNKLLARQDMPWYWAAKEQNADHDPQTYYPSSARYASLLLLASGIQMAGPNLTPESFERGLHQAAFPNENAGRAPYYQARVGFDGGRHTMTADAAMIWYDPNGRSTVDPAAVGRQCYVQGGQRFSLGRWPKDLGDPFFTGDCGV